MEYYAVIRGKKPGIYTTWPDCKEQVDRFPKALFRKFAYREAAEQAIKQGTIDVHDRPNEDTMELFA